MTLPMGGTRTALIIATNEYADSGLRRLRTPAQDAAALGRVLSDPAIGGFEVRTLLNQPSHDVNEIVEDFFADRSPEDLLLLHFSCHGVKDEVGELYFATSDTKLQRLGSTAVAADFVNRRMIRSRSRRMVLTLDCCYAGAFERGMVHRAGTGMAIEESFSGGRGRAVITASSAMEYAFEGDEIADTMDARPSIFTSALVHGLETGEADRDQDGMIGLDELYEYVYDKVRDSTPNQTPRKWTFDLQGELYVARRGKPVTTPAALEPELQQAIDHPLPNIRGGTIEALTRLAHGSHAGKALAARLALEQLRDDDSRAVSAAAQTALASLQSTGIPVGPPPLIGPIQAPRAQQPRSVFSGPVGPPHLQQVPASAPVTPEAGYAGPTKATAFSDAPVVTSVEASGAVQVEGGPTVRDRPQASSPQGLPMAGLLAIVGAVLVIVALFPDYTTGFRLGELFGGILFAVITASVAAIAAILTFNARHRFTVAVGLLLGYAGPVVWGILDDLTSAMFPGQRSSAGPGLWLDLAGGIVIALAILIALNNVVRSHRVRIVSFRPVGIIQWMIVLLALLAAVGWLVYSPQLFGGVGYAVSLVVMSLLALLTTTLATRVTPRPFGISLLAASIAGTGAVFCSYFPFPPASIGFSAWPLEVVGAGLIGLVVVGVAFSRKSSAATNAVSSPS